MPSIILVLHAKRIYYLYIVKEWGELKDKKQENYITCIFRARQRTRRILSSRNINNRKITREDTTRQNCTSTYTYIKYSQRPTL